MKKVINLIILILALQATLGAQVIDADKVERNLRQLERKISTGLSLARQYDNPRAMQLLQKAQAELSAAYDFFNRAKTARPAERVPLLIKTRNRFKIAEAIMGQVTRLLLLKPAAQIKTELDRLIQQADFKLSQQSYNRESRYFLQKARAFLEQANREFQNNRFLRGHENLKVARYFAEKALEFADAPGGNAGQENYEDWYKNLKLLLDRAGADMPSAGVNAELYNNARSFLRKARENYKQGNNRRALSQLKVAERLIYRLIDMSEGSRDSEQQLRANLQSLGQYLNTVSNEAREDNSKGMRWLKKARQLYRAARNDFDKKRYTGARRNINLSQRLALKAYDAFTRNSAGDVDGQLLKQRFDEVRQLIALQEQRLSGQDNADLRTLHEQGRALFLAAEKSSREGNEARARYQLILSLRLLNRVERLSRDQNSRPDISAFTQNRQRLYNIIQRFRGNDDLSTAEKEKIQALEKLLAQAQKLADQGRLSAAMEILNVVQSQIRTLLDSE